MLSLKTVLVPTDFSDASETALRYGKAWPRRSAPRSTSSTSWRICSPTPGRRRSTSPRCPTCARKSRKSRASGSATMLPEAERERLRAREALLAGNPFLEIIRYAKAHDIDLIVMGTHGRGPIAHMLLGSVAEKVVRKSPCPVLTVRDAQHEFVMP